MSEAPTDADDPASATFTLGTDPGMIATFGSRRFTADGRLDLFAVDLAGLDFHAHCDVAHSVYGPSPRLWFDDLAASWQGWSGAKTWRAMEDELGLEATCSRTGHVAIVVAVPARPGSGWHWSAQGFVRIEAGRLERLAGQARRFFADRDA